MPRLQKVKKKDIQKLLPDNDLKYADEVFMLTRKKTPESDSLVRIESAIYNCERSGFFKR